MGLKRISVFIVSCIITLSSVSLGQVINTGVIKVDLNAAREAGVWTGEGNNGTTDITVAAEVPGGIYSDLDANAILSSEIYHDYNDMENRWVGRTNWTYSRQFTPTSDLLSKAKVVLVCEGLDTIAEVFINDISVGKSENMFVRYVFDIKSALQPGINKIRVAFKSPVEYAANEYQKHVDEMGYPVVPPELVPAYRGENKAQMIRKMQAAFSWDWGPSYASSGIWKNIFIEGLDGAVIRDVLIFNEPNTPTPDETDSTLWNLTARVYFETASEMEEGTLTIQRAGTDQSVSIPVSITTNDIDDFKDVHIIVRGSTAKLWWPNGYGDQNLYTYDVKFESSTADETSTKSVRVGFRKVELIQDLVNANMTEWGREFYFRVNGVQMYSKGSNSIPIHVLPERATPEMTRWLLESSRDAHANMIRVWGGGIYESDVFFDLADELGIFIWEDFMFACAMYSATPDFLDNVHKEVETQVKRLQHHPSLAMWAANNENEAALRGNWYGTEGPDFDKYVADFIALYITTIKRYVEELDPSRECISSSPTNGIQSEEEGWVAQNPYDLRYGDIHHYDYRSDSWDWKIFKRTRYASEYGYQAFPYVETMRTVASDFQDWTWESVQADHRQHHPGGQEEIRELIRNHLPFPTNYNSTEAFPSMLYMSQIMQSTGQKTQTEFYRRLMDKFNETDGTGHNMGALYWQLNDIWEGCSWASMEITGRWRMFHYYARRAFAPVLASPYKDVNGDIVIEVISDSREDYVGVLRVRVVRSTSLTPLIDENAPVLATFMTSEEAHRISASRIQEVGCGDNTVAPCVVYVSMPGTPDNFLYIDYPKDKQFVTNPNLRVSDAVLQSDGKTVAFTLNSDSVAQFVFLNLKEDSYGKFSDNGFILVEAQRNMTYTSRDPITLQRFTTQLDIMSLYDVTSVA